MQDNNVLLQNLLAKVFKLPENYIEALLQDFLAILVKSDSIFVVLSILLKTDPKNKYLKAAYRFAIGIMNILQTGQRDKAE